MTAATANFAPHNVAAHLTALARSQPDTPALLCLQGFDAAGKVTYAPYCYRHLEERSNALAHGLGLLGITRGTRTALCLRPGIWFFAVTFALFKLGAVPVLIDPGIGLKNFGRCLSQAQPAAFIGTPLAHLLRRTLGWARQTVRINVTTERFGGHALRAIQARGEQESAKALPITTPDDPAAILFTSGSTGPAKGVLYTHANFTAQVAALRDLYHIQPGEIDLATFPLFGLFGPALGMTTVIPVMDFTRPGQVEPRNILEPIRQLQITNLFGSPALLQRVGQWGAQQGIKLPTLRRVISAGAPVPAKVIERFSTMLAPDAQIFTPYGATEALPVCSIGSHEILTATRHLTDQGQGVCVGRPVGGATVRVITITDDPIPTWTDDLLLPQGQIGEIVVQGPAVTTAYYDRPEATHLAKIPDPRGGFYHRMGDVGYFDATGRLWFCGRKSHRVRLPGGDLFTIPVEAIFNTHPKVYRTALVGVSIHHAHGSQSMGQCAPTGTPRPAPPNSLPSVESNRAAGSMPESGSIRPVLCVELQPEAARADRATLRAELAALAARYPHTQMIKDFLFHPGFPVDIRHNAKIGREKLALWAAEKLT